MIDARTEALHDAARGLDGRPLPEISALLADAQVEAATSASGVTEEIASAGAAMARTIRQGGVLHYVAAGSSGLMAAADALELGGTFSIPAAQIRIHMAGGMPTGVTMPGDTEDQPERLDDLAPGDTVIAVSASGSTPYTLAAAEAARRAGATLVAIANNPGAELLRRADIAICLETPPEILSGSTRMGAGTAQKIALNMMSTLMAVKLGHVHDGMMVNLRADNTKLRARARGIVREISGVDGPSATAALDQTDGEVKAAVLVAAGGLSPDAARTLLGKTRGHLRAALARLSDTTQQQGDQT